MIPQDVTIRSTQKNFFTAGTNCTDFAVWNARNGWYHFVRLKHFELSYTGQQLFPKLALKGEKKKKKGLLIHLLRPSRERLRET